jgi:hypothetical protein
MLSQENVPNTSPFFLSLRQAPSQKALRSTCWSCELRRRLDPNLVVMNLRCAWFHETVDLGWAARAGVVWVIDAEMNDSSGNLSNSMRLWDVHCRRAREQAAIKYALEG